MRVAQFFSASFGRHAAQAITGTAVSAATYCLKTAVFFLRALPIHRKALVHCVAAKTCSGFDWVKACKQIMPGWTVAHCAR
jgi:hypothetical protein